MESLGYTVTPARYAKGQMAVRLPDGDGYKTRAERLLCALNFRYTNRCRAFIGSPSKVRRFEQLYADGWDASFVSQELEAPKAIPC